MDFLTPTPLYLINSYTIFRLLLDENVVKIDVNIEVNFGIYIYPWLLINIYRFEPNFVWKWLLFRSIFVIPLT